MELFIDTIGILRTELVEISDEIRQTFLNN